MTWILWRAAPIAFPDSIVPRVPELMQGEPAIDFKMDVPPPTGSPDKNMNPASLSAATIVRTRRETGSKRGRERLAHLSPGTVPAQVWGDCRVLPSSPAFLQFLEKGAPSLRLFIN